MFMMMAMTVSLRGTCPRLSVGAIIVKHNHVVSTGYNGAPSGLPHCTHGPDEPEGGCKDTVHAEANAIAFAAREGIATRRGTIYCTHSPCIECAKLIVSAGINRLVYMIPYRDEAPLKLLRAAGLKVEKVEPESVQFYEGTGVKDAKR